MQQRIMTESRYFGIPTWKNPADFWIYQEILYGICHHSLDGGPFPGPFEAVEASHAITVLLLIAAEKRFSLPGTPRVICAG
jgi:hypothetical protein